MKTVKCDGPNCEGVIGWTTGESRGTQYIDVPDDYEGLAFCSYECQIYYQAESKMAKEKSGVAKKGARKPKATEPSWIEVNERKRVYHFPGNEELVLENVVRLEVRESGKHRIELASGKKLFVNTGWLWIDIDVDDWTV